MKAFRKREKVEKILDKINENTAPNRLQKITNKISIGSSIATLALAIFGICLTMKYGNDRKQLDKLTEIAESHSDELKNQSEELKSLAEISHKQDSINKALTNIAQSSKSQEDLSSKLVDVQKTQTSIVSGMDKANRDNVAFTDKTEHAKMANLFTKLKIILFAKPKYWFKESFSYLEMKNFYSDVQVLFQVENNNLYLQKNDSLLKRWKNLYKLMNGNYNYITDYRNWKDEMRYNPNGPPIHDSLAKVLYYRPAFAKFIEEIFDFYYNFYHDFQ